VSRAATLALPLGDGWALGASAHSSIYTHQSVDAELVLPTIRSAVEKQLNLIAQGKADYRQVLGHTLDVFKRKFHYFVDSIAGKPFLFLPLCQGTHVKPTQNQALGLCRS
jgi:hypothetical protein